MIGRVMGCGRNVGVVVRQTAMLFYASVILTKLYVFGC